MAPVQRHCSMQDAELKNQASVVVFNVIETSFSASAAAPAARHHGVLRITRFGVILRTASIGIKTSRTRASEAQPRSGNRKEWDYRRPIGALRAPSLSVARLMPNAHTDAGRCWTRNAPMENRASVVLIDIIEEPSMRAPLLLCNGIMPYSGSHVSRFVQHCVLRERY